MVNKMNNNKEDDKKLLILKESYHVIKPISEKNNVNVKSTNGSTTIPSKTNTTKAFETIEGIILKLADKIIVDESSKNDKQSKKNVEKSQKVNLNKKSIINAESKRMPVSVYLAPIENFKSLSNSKNENVVEIHNDNVRNFDINLNNNNLYTPIIKTQSYENLNLGTPKGKKKTIIVPITNNSYNSNLTTTSSINFTNKNEKNSKHNSNPDEYIDTSIQQLSLQKKQQKNDIKYFSPTCNNMMIPSTKQCLNSISNNSTVTAIEILKNKNKKPICNMNNIDIDKSFEDAFEEECRTCPECSSSKKYKKNIHTVKTKTGIKKPNPNIPVIKVDTKCSVPKTTECLTTNPFMNIQIAPPICKNKKNSNENIYTIAPMRNRNRNIDNDSGIENPQFNDDLSIFPYTCKIITDQNNLNSSTNILSHKTDKKLVPLENNKVKNDNINIEHMVQIKSPKVARFYDMQQNYNEKFQNHKHVRNDSFNDIIVKTAKSLSPINNKKEVLRSLKLSSVKSVQNTFSTASNGGINDLSQSTEKTSGMTFDTAVANESEDVITDSFAPIISRDSLKSQCNVKKWNRENKLNEEKCTTENFSNEIIVVVNDKKGNRVTINMTNIIKSFSNNNESLSPYEIYINGNQIWKKE